jgi:hypothetical protein
MGRLDGPALREPRTFRSRPRRSWRIRPWPLLLGALVILVAGIWIGPRLFDWNAHRAAIEAAASGFLGRDVVISGPIRLSLLPEPSITAERVEVQDDGDGVRMGTRALTLNLSLGDLLTGRVEVTHVALDRPVIRLPWPLPSGPISIEPPPWLASLSADISRGTLMIGPLRVTEADLSIVTGGADTALRIDGMATAGGAPWQVGIGLSWPETDGSAPLQITLQSGGTPASTFGFKGVMQAKGQVQGQFTAHGDDLAALVPAPALPFDARGTLHADGRRVNLADLALTLGTMPASGELQLRLTPALAPMSPTPSLAIRLHTQLLDLGPWLRAFPAGSGSAEPLSLDLSADTAIFGDGLLRSFGLKLVTSPTRIRVDAVHANLPGEAAIALSGLYDPATTSFTGKMSLGVPSPAITLHWLAQSKLLPDFSGALSGLSSLDIAANLAADPQRAALTGIVGRMNDTTVSGGLVLSLGAVPVVDAGLAFGRIDLGQWLPPDWLADPPRPDLLAHDLAGVTADLRLSAGEVWLGDARIDHVLLDAAIRGGSLNLRRLAGQDQGMQVLVSGAMNAHGDLRNARLLLAAPHASPFVALLPPRLRGATAFWAAPLAASITAAGPPTALALSVQGILGDLAFSAQPVMDLTHDHWQGAVTLRHPSATRLLRGLGFPDAASWLGEGSFSVVATAASDGSSWAISPLTFSIGMLHGGGRLARTSARPPDERRITGTLAIDTLPWPELDEDEPIPVDLLRGWQATLGVTVGQVLDDLSPVASHVRAFSDVTNGVLRLSIASAEILGGKARGTVKLSAGQPPTLQATLALSDAHLPSSAAPDRPAWLPPGVTASALDGHAMLMARGYSLGSWLASLDSRLGFSAAHGTLAGIDLAATGKSGLFAGATPFDVMNGTATVSQGDLQLDAFLLRGPAGEMGAAGQVDLVRGICNLNLALKPSGGGATVNTVLQGPLRHPTGWIVHGTAMN